MMKLTGDGKRGSLPFALGTASLSLSAVVLGQLTYALSSSAGMAAATVGLILMCSKVIDGISDLIAGYIIDKTHTRLGKSRPYDLMAIPMWIMVIFCFSVPGLSNVGKIIWVLLTYNLCQSVFYTFCSVSQPVRAKRSFQKTKRAGALALGGFMSAFLATAVSVILPLLIERFEKQPHGWTIIAVCFAVPCMIMSLLMFFLVPEMEQEKVSAEPGGLQTQEKLSFGKSAGCFFKNKYVLILVVMVVSGSMANIILGTAATYYFRYYIGNLSLQSIVSLVSVLGYILLAFIPMLEKRISHRNLILLAFGLMFIGGAGKYLNGKNLGVLIIFGMLFTVGVTVIQTVRSLALMDCMAYEKTKFGIETEGVYASAIGFADKLANGAGAFVVGIILESGRWDASLATQPESAMAAIQFLYNGLPALLALIGFVATCFFLVEKKTGSSGNQQ